MGAADIVCYGVSSLLAKAKRQRSGGWLHLTRSPHPALWLITWDPTQTVATRPLSIQKNGTWYTYGLDLTKNVCEVFGSSGYIGTAYTYTPFGEVTASGNVDQPIQWSSEMYDSELGLVYYNWRYYSSLMGRWFSRDPIFLIYAIFYSTYYMSTYCI
jgi:RHS repeat-associated protein